MSLKMLKLNIGCGDDYREDFINIDGSSEVKTDKRIDISIESLLSHFNINTIDYILANDIIEHHFHWEAITILNEIYAILKENGILEMRIPDCEYIINSNLPIERKLTLLFGGQDIPQGNKIMDKSRQSFPQYFCHKYGWSKERIKKDLLKIGFKDIIIKNVGTNIIITGKK